MSDVIVLASGSPFRWKMLEDAGLEIEVEKPTDPVAQLATWSDYKSRNTAKFLIGCTPDGAISFISKAFPGSISDEQIVKDTALLN